MTRAAGIFGVNEHANLSRFDAIHYPHSYPNTYIHAEYRRIQTSVTQFFVARTQFVLLRAGGRSFETNRLAPRKPSFKHVRVHVRVLVRVVYSSRE